jgi:hypothetical protein
MMEQDGVWTRHEIMWADNAKKLGINIILNH